MRPGSRGVATSDRSGVVVLEIVLRDLVRRRGPDAVVREDVADDLVEIADAVRRSEDRGVERDAHDASALLALGVERVELVLADLREILGLLGAEALGEPF